MEYAEKNRRLTMLRTALPYTTGASRRAMEVLLEADTLSDMLTRPVSADLNVCDTTEDFQNKPEEMLLHMQEYCTPGENEIIQTVLNFIKADRLFRNYKLYVQSHPLDTPDLAAAQTAQPNRLFDFLLAQLSPEQRSMLEQLRQLNALTPNS